MGKKIVLTGGGTAGHVTANLALIPHLQEEGYEITYIGSISGIERKLIEDYHIPYVPIETGKFRRYFDPKNFSDLLGTLDVYAYGGPEAMRFGYVPGLFGFKSVVCSTNLPDGVNGVILNRNTVGIASRYLAPLGGAYPQTWKATDPDSGFSIGFRVFADLKTGRRYVAGDALVGAAIFYNGTKGIRLING